MDNTTAAGSSSADFCPQPLWCFFDLIVVTLVTYLILLGNIANLIVLLSTASLRNSHGYLLISLSVADLGIGVVAAMSIYPAATFEGTADAWPYGDGACLVTAVAGQVFLANSGNTLTILSVERYFAVVHPLKYSRIWTRRLSLICITVCWVISVAVYLPIVIVAGHEYVPAVHTCMPTLLGHPILAAVILLGLILPSISVIVVTSCVVNRKLKESYRLRAEMMPNVTPNATGSKDSQSSVSRMPSVKIFRMVRVMTIAVTSSWMPFCITGVVALVAEVELPRGLYFYSYWLLLANSFFNTIIYFLMNKTFHDKLDDVVMLIAPKYCLKLNEREKRRICGCCDKPRARRVCEPGGTIETKHPTLPGDSQHEAGHQTFIVTDINTSVVDF